MPESSSAPRRRWEEGAVLVTGGAGYIGSHVVRQLQARGVEIVVLDNLSRGHPDAARGTTLVRGDVRDADLLARVFAEHRLTAVVHLAGVKSVDESLRDPGAYFDNNVLGSLALLKACRAANVRSFVFSSTCAVYGIPAQLPISEETEVRPETPYGESKLMVERMLHWFDVAHEVGYVALRYFNAAGAAEDGDIGENWDISTNLVPVVMKSALGMGEPIQVFGTDYPTADGTAVRDYIHVVDLADAHLRALDYLSAGGASVTLNLGTGVGASVREVITTTQRHSGRPVPFVEAGRRPGDAAAVWAASGAAQRTLGWTPRYGLDEIIASAWQWHSTHPNGFATNPDAGAKDGA